MRISQKGNTSETDFWTEVIAITSKDENLNKAHVKYLEYTLYQTAIQAARYAMHNKNTPNKPAISEADQAAMLEFAENMKLMVGTLGHRVFEPLVTSKRSDKHEYQIQAARGANARGVQTSESFVVLKGSRVAASEVPSKTEYIKRKRAALAALKIALSCTTWTLANQEENRGMARIMNPSNNGTVNAISPCSGL